MSKRIVLDAGHGLNTPGKRCMKQIDAKETREWFLNQRIASKVQEKLKSYDVEVLRVDDPTGKIDIDLNTRCRKANEFGADIYCSLHHNAGIAGGPGGGLVIITYDNSAEAIKMQNCLYDCLIAEGALKGNRSNPKYSNNSLRVLNGTKMIAVLAEHGFMDSTTDTPIILTDDYAEKMANGWIAFFEQYLGITKIKKEEQVPGKLYYVQVGAFRSKENADALVAELIEKGYSAIIK